MNILQNELFEIFCEIDEVCRKNDVSYTMLGGTLLGAVREKGFIEWDDDIDIGMTRAEYEKFRTKMFQSSVCDIIEYFTAGAFQVVKRNDKNNVKACVDIFVFDYITENKVLQKLKTVFTIVLQAMLKDSNTINLTSQKAHGKLKTFVYKCFYLVGRPIPKKVKIAWYKKFCTEFLTGNRQLYYISNEQAKYIRRTYHKNYVENVTDIEFEGRLFKASCCSKDILLQNYGADYMVSIKDENNFERHDNFRNTLHSTIKN